MIAVVVVVVGERAALSPNVEGSVRVRLGGGDDDAKSLSSLLLSLSSVGRSDCRCLLQRFDMLRMMMMIDDVSVLSVPPILDSQITTNQTTGRFGHDSYNQCVSKGNQSIQQSIQPSNNHGLFVSTTKTSYQPARGGPFIRHSKEARAVSSAVWRSQFGPSRDENQTKPSQAKQTRTHPSKNVVPAATTIHGWGRSIEKHTFLELYACMDGFMDGCMYGLIHVWMDGVFTKHTHVVSQNSPTRQKKEKGHTAYKKKVS